MNRANNGIWKNRIRPDDMKSKTSKSKVPSQRRVDRVLASLRYQIRRIDALRVAYRKARGESPTVPAK